MKEIILPSGVSVATHLDKKRRPQVDYKKAIEAAEVLQGMQRDREIPQTSATIKVTTSDPVALFFHGDQHIGNMSVNYRELFRQNEAIMKMRNAFLAITGDICDHAFIFREGGDTDNLSYTMQGEVAMNMLKDMDESGKVLWYTSGNHDMFRDNFYNSYFGGFNFPVIGPNHGTVDLTVGQADYDVFSFHKISMGNSTMSPFLACQRAVEYFDQNADIVVRGHTHRKAVGQYKLGIDGHQKLRTMIETGTFKPDEHFQRAQGNARTAMFDYGGAGVILMPDQQEVVPFYEFDKGVELLNGYIGLRNVLTAGAGKIFTTR
jgi:UDP-2,3-diacylglucosamine pyrophosphatase LpxH